MGADMGAGVEEGEIGEGGEDDPTKKPGKGGGRDGMKLLGRDFVLRDEDDGRRKPLKGRRRGKTKQVEKNRVNEKKEKLGFIGSWARAAKSKDTSERD